jgi:tellurite methyltransferase
MSAEDREHWNRRYAAAGRGARPSDWLRAHETLIRPRQPHPRALDLACGTGQNALYLARLGYQVDAWDISDVALDLLRAQLADSGQSLEVVPRQVDLNVASVHAATYDLVLDINFLERRLFHDMAEALCVDGLLLVRALMRKPAGDNRTPAYLLEPGELAAAFAQLETLEYAQDPVEGWAALIAIHHPQHGRSTGADDQRPTYLGGRFSRNERRPSAWSSVWRTTSARAHS